MHSILVFLEIKCNYTNISVHLEMTEILKLCLLYNLKTVVHRTLTQWMVFEVFLCIRSRHDRANSCQVCSLEDTELKLKYSQFRCAVWFAMPFMPFVLTIGIKSIGVKRNISRRLFFHRKFRHYFFTIKHKILFQNWELLYLKINAKK